MCALDVFLHLVQRVSAQQLYGKGRYLGCVCVCGGGASLGLGALASPAGLLGNGGQHRKGPFGPMRAFCFVCFGMGVAGGPSRAWPVIMSILSFRGEGSSRACVGGGRSTALREAKAEAVLRAAMLESRPGLVLQELRQASGKPPPRVPAARATPKRALAGGAPLYSSRPHEHQVEGQRAPWAGGASSITWSTAHCPHPYGGVCIYIRSWLGVW